MLSELSGNLIICIEPTRSLCFGEPSPCFHDLLVRAPTGEFSPHSRDLIEHKFLLIT